MHWTPDKIKRRRDELGDTQEEFAKRVGQSLRTITAWEAGESRPRKTTELDKLGPPKPLPAAHARQRGPLEEIDLSAAKVPDLVAHLLDVATELNRRIPNQARGSIGSSYVEFDGPPPNDPFLDMDEERRIDRRQQG